jgi:predicted Zn-dependent protease
MQLEWAGSYLDGKSADRQPAAVRLTPTGLEILLQGGQQIRWPYAEIRQTQGAYEGEQIRLERGDALSEAIVIGDHRFLTDLHRLAPAVGRRFHNPEHRRLRLRLTVYAAVVAVGLSLAIYLWGIPALASLTAPLIPVTWEEAMGRSTALQLAPEKRRCTNLERLRKLDEIFDRLTAELPEHPYTFRGIVVDHPMVNAFAAPGGYIVLFRGLIERTETAEELAGVLAHEIQHVTHRHTTQLLLQQASTGVLIAALTGDISGAMAFGLDSARQLGMLRYNRLIEEEADREGMRLLMQAGIDPRGMITFFEKLQQEHAEMPEMLEYLSTHPTTQARIDHLRALARQQPAPPATLLPDYDWSDMKKVCQQPS